MARAARRGAALGLTLGLGGCPGGAVLEEPEKFPQYGGGTTSTGGAGGSAGTSGSAGAATAGSAGSGGAAGSTGSAGTSGSAGAGGSAGSIGCDIAVAMKDNCDRPGCHNTAYHEAALDFSNLANMPALLVDRPALHGDIGCNAPGTLFRACDAAELVALGCPTDVLLIDSRDFDASWVVKKLKGEHGTCGKEMPISPGNSVMYGWGEARRTCFLEYFRSLIPAP